jgi:alpha-beta hydrolase superfamily lysophospholipase
MRPGFVISIAIMVGVMRIATNGKADEIPVQEVELQAHDVAPHVRITGDTEAGDVLLTIAMGPGFSSHYMATLEQLAGESLAVVTYDQRGTGRSTEPSGGYELLNYVADLEAVRRAVGAERVHLFGHCIRLSVTLPIGGESPLE